VLTGVAGFFRIMAIVWRKELNARRLGELIRAHLPQGVLKS